MTRLLSRGGPLRPLSLALFAFLAAGPAALADLTTIDLDTVPVLRLAPSSFSTPAQTITVPGLATFTGGTLVGNPLNLASFRPGGGTGNAYGTRSGTSFGYSQNLTINFDPLAVVSRVQGTLFNGFTDLNSYTVAIFNGATQLRSQTFTDLADNGQSTGFGRWDLSGSSITRLVITPDTTFSGGAYDYFIDNVGVTYSSAAVPEPATALSLTLGLVGLCGLGYRHRRSRSRA